MGSTCSKLLAYTESGNSGDGGHSEAGGHSSHSQHLCYLADWHYPPLSKPYEGAGCSRGRGAALRLGVGLRSRGRCLELWQLKQRRVDARNRGEGGEVDAKAPRIVDLCEGGAALGRVAGPDRPPPPPPPAERAARRPSSPRRRRRSAPRTPRGAPPGLQTGRPTVRDPCRADRPAARVQQWRAALRARAHNTHPKTRSK